ncbi:unnamed protein product [Clonostachys chloroleuca]|uniref:Rab-GAP TBC domain-containing protein n=1 Tax=Clonostachys chloroleuca TaxID=1926264 RepID=A0AA35LUW5_9HYPO|nr:unnamed protein product [Clonostachys chloroleuca]
MDSVAGLERSQSQQSHRSITSHRSTTVRASKARKRLSQPSSSASSVAPSDKSLTSFPSFSPESPVTERFDEDRFKTATIRDRSADTRGARSGSMVDSLTEPRAARDALFEDAPLAKAPGALHQADNAHIERLVARHGAVGLVRQLAEDLAQRDGQISLLRRRADEREMALRRIIRECGLSNLELETRLRTVEDELRKNGRTRNWVNTGLSDMMTDAMQDSMTRRSHDEEGDYKKSTTIRASNQNGNNASNNDQKDGKPAESSGKGTTRGWKEYFWGTGTTKKSNRGSSFLSEGVNSSTMVRSHSSLERRPILQDDLFKPPDAAEIPRSASRASFYSANNTERKPSSSFASMALRLVAGGAISGREAAAESRGRAVSNSTRADSLRGASASSNKTARSARTVSVAGGPKALMAMRRSATPVPQAQAAASRAQAADMWDSMVGTSPGNSASRQESYGPVEMDAIRSPESQPPTLTHIYKNYDNSEYLTDRFGFIYDQRRKKRQREAAQMAKHVRKGSRPEMMLNGRSGISPNLIDDLPPSMRSVSSGSRADSPISQEDSKSIEEGKSNKRWQDYLKIATFPTELLSHTPSTGAASLEVLEGTDAAASESQPNGPLKSPAITPTDSGLVPAASTTTAVDNGTTTPPSQPEVIPELVLKEDREPVKLLLQQLSDVHDALQREKMPRWNDFLRKVRAERRREEEAAIAAANAVAEARYERPTMILPETRVADGEMIGISNLGNKGKVGRAKWNEFKSLVLGGIPVAYRSKIWSECSGAASMRIPGYYEDLVAQKSEDDDPVVISQIEMDINRTLTDNIFFRKGPGVKKLREVLVAYARRNKDVGYCQGMNLIAANLLLIMPSAEDAFWVLASVIEKILPQGYYDHSLMSSRADQQVLRQYVSTVLPKLSAHLDTLSIELEALTFQWFLSVFTDCLCAEALFRVWDVVLCTHDGSTFLFQVALALLKLNEGNLLQRQTPAGVYTYINHHMTEHAISIDSLMQASEALRKLVKREEVEQMREKAIQAEKDAAAARDGRVNGVAVEPTVIEE